MTTIDGRQIIPAADLPQRPVGRNDMLVGVLRSANSLATFPVSDLPTPKAAQQAIDALKAGQSTSAIYTDTLASLQGTVGDYEGQGAFVLNGAGAGQYRWDGSAWQFLREDSLAGKADRGDLSDLESKIDNTVRTVALDVPYEVNFADQDGYSDKGLSEGIIDLKTVLLANSTLIGTTGAFSLVDHDGYFIEVVDPTGGSGLVRDAAAVGLNTSLSVRDDDGYVVELLSSEGAVSKTDDASLYGVRNASNLDASRSVAAQINSESTAVVYDYTHFPVYGQSLSNGTEGWPALSKAQPYNNVMVGGSVRQASIGSAAFTPVGGSSAFQPLVANVMSTSMAVLTDAEVAALPPGNGAFGETVAEGLVNSLKKLHNLRKGVTDDSIAFVASSSGVGGRTIAQLTKGANPNIWNVLVGHSQAAKANAVSSAKSYGIGAFVWLQGENDYPSATKGGYKASLKQLWLDFKADVANAVSGQQLPPVMLMYQTGASFTSDGNGLDTALSVGQAQLEFNDENSDVYMVGPVYPYTDKHTSPTANGHLDANGYRWWANLAAKVAYRVLELRQGWKPLSPRKVAVAGRTISIDFHVPEPPLAFDTPYLSHTATDFPSKGFTVRDSVGVVPLSGVRIVFDTIVELTLSRDLVGTAYVRYADKTYHDGNGCLRDSDSFVAPDRYVYQAGSGQYPEANIAALVDKPYPMHNWCVAFNLKIQ
ncbi:hypothetical protein [Stenotrophomonas maltophilia]|uniref:hypothetical protein n=1 Tax=Stenotrophomonas maltophilia TaxID=40324 RepID=UPI0013DCFFB1|nr:hypothetical protein [Stenotrophomonas maltophilia]